MNVSPVSFVGKNVRILSPSRLFIEGLPQDPYEARWQILAGLHAFEYFCNFICQSILPGGRSGKNHCGLNLFMHRLHKGPDNLTVMQ